MECFAQTKIAYLAPNMMSVRECMGAKKGAFYGNPPSNSIFGEAITASVEAFGPQHKWYRALVLSLELGIMDIWIEIAHINIYIE